MDYFNQQSERLKYRKLTRNDISSWTEFFIENDGLKYLGLDLQKEKETLSEEWVLNQLNRYENQGLGHLAIELKDCENLIGTGGIVLREVDGNKEYEIGYALKPKYWGNGYATEIAKTMKRYGSDIIETNRLISIIHVNNFSSANVAIKNGMKALFKTEYYGMDVDVYGVKNLQ